MKLLINCKTAWLASMLLCLGLQSRAQNDAVYLSGNVMINSGDTIQWYGNVTADATARLYIQDGGVIYFYGQSFTLMPGAQVYGAADALFTAVTQGAGTGKVAFWQPNPNNSSTAQQLLDGGNATSTTQNTFTGIRINNPQGVKLVNSSARIGSDLNFVNGHLYTGGQDVRLAANGTFTGYDQNKYIVTNGTGNGSVSHVVGENLASALVFPVGMADNDYTPATITPAVSNTVHVNVTNYTQSASQENTNNATGYGMQRTWNIYGDVKGGTTTIALQHNSSTNQAYFNSAANFVTRFMGASWEPGVTGASTIGVPAAGTEVRSRNYDSLTTLATNNLAYYSKATIDLTLAAPPLPVYLSSFTANAVAGRCAAQLQWTTGEERSFDHFTVQYSTDGSSFEPSGSVKSNGNAMGSTYNYTMEQPAGRMYYRLQMTDQDGTVSYSNTLSVLTQCNAGAAATWTVYPNPSGAGSTQYLQYTSTGDRDQSLKVVVNDLMGRRIWAADIKAASGKNVYSIPSGNWPRGTYVINLYDQQGGAVDIAQKISLR